MPGMGMRSSGRPRDRPTDSRQAAVWLLALLLHLLATWALTRRAPEASAAAAPLELAFISLPPPAKPLPAPAAPPLRVDAAARPDNNSPLTAQAMPHPSAGTSNTILPATTTDDRWTLPASSSNDDGIRFARRNPMRSINPIRRGPPERFRMRDPTSLANVLRAVAQALLWPPGYSDDPCTGLAEAAQVLRESPTDGQRALLEEVVRQQGQYCN